MGTTFSAPWHSDDPPMDDPSASYSEGASYEEPMDDPRASYSVEASYEEYPHVATASYSMEASYEEYPPVAAASYSMEASYEEYPPADAATASYSMEANYEEYPLADAAAVASFEEEDEAPSLRAAATTSARASSKKWFQSVWSEEDEIVILNGLINYAAEKGADPSTCMSDFFNFIKDSLHFDPSKKQLSDKIRKLKLKYQKNAAKKRFYPKNSHEEKIFTLSKMIWGNEGENAKYGMTSQEGGMVLSQERLERLAFSAETLGLPEHIVQQGLNSISESKKAEMCAKWEEVRIAELEHIAKKNQLISEQAQWIADTWKSRHH